MNIVDVQWEVYLLDFVITLIYDPNKAILANFVSQGSMAQNPYEVSFFQQPTQTAVPTD